MTSTPVLLENERKESEIVAPDSISVGLGVLWIVGVAVAWDCQADVSPSRKKF